MCYKTKPNPEDVKNYESTLDSAAHELIMLIADREEEVTGSTNNAELYNAYYVFRNALQGKAKQLYPDYDFENF